MGKKVLHGPVTFGRNHSYPSTSITKKVAKMEKFPLVHKVIILLKTRTIFFRKSHNRWKAFAHLLKLKCLIRFGKTFQPGGNITQYRPLLQPQARWLFASILRLREVWQDILHLPALFKNKDFLSKDEFLSNIDCWLS